VFDDPFISRHDCQNDSSNDALSGFGNVRFELTDMTGLGGSGAREGYWELEVLLRSGNPELRFLGVDRLARTFHDQALVRDA